MKRHIKLNKQDFCIQFAYRLILPLQENLDQLQTHCIFKDARILQKLEGLDILIFSKEKMFLRNIDIIQTFFFFKPQGHLLTMSIASALGLPKQRDSSAMKTSKAAAVMRSWCDRMKTHRDLNAPSDSHGNFPWFWCYVEGRGSKMEESKRQNKTSLRLGCLGTKKILG